MAWEPRVPLVLAESVVDFPRIDAHIIDRRAALDRYLAGPVRDYADSLHLHHGVPSHRALDEIDRRLLRGLQATYLFGFREAARELRALRRVKAEHPMLAAAPVPELRGDANRFLTGLARQGRSVFAAQMGERYHQYEEAFDRQTELRDRASRAMHNLVLELVGHVLNAGRTLAALGQDEPVLASLQPARFAYRSEQLDTRTCHPCEGLHGRIVEVGTSEYYALMPPNGCLGRGRCRGVYVYGDDPSDFELLPGQRRLL